MVIKKLKRIKKYCRRMMANLAKKVEDAAQNNENKKLYKITIILSNRWNRNRPVRDNKGELLTGWKEQASRWHKHFSEILNCEITKEEENEN
jgi:hypothetical protein